MPAAAGQQQLQGDGQRRQARRLQGRQHRAVRRSTPCRATAGRRRSRTASTSRATSSGAHWSTLTAEMPKARGDRQARPAALEPRGPDRARRRRQGQRRALLRRRRQRARAAGARGVRGRQRDRDRRGCCCSRDSPLHPDGLANSSGQVGRNYMRHLTGSVYGEFEQPVRMYRGETMAGIITDEARQRPRPRLRRRLLHADAGARRCRSWPPSSTRAAGAPTSRRAWRPTSAWRACGSSARTCRRRPTA